MAFVTTLHRYITLAKYLNLCLKRGFTFSLFVVNVVDFPYRYSLALAF